MGVSSGGRRRGGGAARRVRTLDQEKHGRRVGARAAAVVDDVDGGGEVDLPLAAAALAHLEQAQEQHGGEPVGAVAARKTLVRLAQRAPVQLGGRELDAGVRALEVRGAEREQRVAQRRLLQRHRHKQRQERVQLVRHHR